MNKVKCIKCGYVTQTKSKLLNITCSSCSRKTPNTPIKDIKNKNKDSLYINKND